MWINGPFAPGPWPDITIFWSFLKQLLLPGERVEADLGYRGDPSVDSPNVNCPNPYYIAMKATVRARHETINRRLKSFNVLGGRFRHEIKKHGMVFEAVAVVTQLQLLSEPVFPVQYQTYVYYG